jgi:hypothetical protein
MVFSERDINPVVFTVLRNGGRLTSRVTPVPTKPLIAKEMTIVKTVIKQIKSKFLIASVAAVFMFGSAQQTKAAFYPTYYSYYAYYLSIYQSTGIAQYYYDAVAYYYYYLAGYYGDYASFYYDSFGYKSTTYRGGNSNAGYYYNYYAYYGDYFAHL